MGFRGLQGLLIYSEANRAIVLSIPMCAASIDNLPHDVILLKVRLVHKDHRVRTVHMASQSKASRATTAFPALP